MRMVTNLPFVKTFVLAFALPLAACSSGSLAVGADPDGGGAHPEGGGDPDGGGGGKDSGDGAVEVDAGPFVTTPGRSIWFDGIDTVKTTHVANPAAMVMFAGECDGATFPRLGQDTYTFDLRTSTLTWDESCHTAGDGGSPTSNKGSREVSSAERDAIVTALKAIRVVPTVPSTSDADQMRLDVTAGSSSQTYTELYSLYSGTSLTLIQGEVDLLPAVHALAHR